MNFDKLPTITKISMLLIKLQREFLEKEETRFEDYHKLLDIANDVKKLQYLVLTKIKIKGESE